jgi:alcohol dehydrogenase class IV
MAGVAGPLPSPAHPETVFTYAAPPLIYGPGAIRDIPFHLGDAKRVLIVTDAGVAATGAPQRIVGLLRCQAAVYDDVHVEPTDASLQAITDYVRHSGPWDAFLAVGGGSSIDTAKAANLMSTNPGDLLDYVNPPIGGGRAPEHPLKPLIAVPTTTGTGSESTTICVLDVLDRHVKTGISHPRLRPSLAVVDPELTMTQPPMVTACAGLDILCHALESYTARPFGSFEAKTPEQRVPYCGANPISDMWAQAALGLMAEAFVPAVRDDDPEARAKMALAATLAGMGFGNAGVHIPHANAYPIAGRVRDYRPPDYPQDEPLVPHGMAVSLTAPAAFRLTETASPQRHRAAAHLLGGEDLPLTLRRIMDEVGMPSGLRPLGFATADIPDLVEGAMAQQRLLALAPVAIGPEDLAHVFEESL